MKTVLLVLLALPLAANATLLYVDYEGIVSTSSHPDFAVGDKFTQTLTIDVDRAPRDRDPDSPVSGDYIAWDCPCGSAFISAPGDVDGLRNWNSVNVTVTDFFDGDGYSIEHMQGFGTPDYRNLHIGVNVQDLLQNDGLVQSFEIVENAGFVRASFESAQRAFVTFVTSRFAVTPTPGQYTCRK